MPCTLRRCCAHVLAEVKFLVKRCGVMFVQGSKLLRDVGPAGSSELAHEYYHGDWLHCLDILDIANLQLTELKSKRRYNTSKDRYLDNAIITANLTLHQ